MPHRAFRAYGFQSLLKDPPRAGLDDDAQTHIARSIQFVGFIILPTVAVRQTLLMPLTPLLECPNITASEKKPGIRFCFLPPPYEPSRAPAGSPFI